MDLSPLYISLKVAVIATLLSFFAGITAAWGVVRMKHGKALADGILTMPMVLPPTVVGFFLLLIFGKNSFIGKFLMLFNINIVFSWAAAVIASTIVSLPLVYRTSRGAFEQMDCDIIYAARTLGMSEWSIFTRVVLPTAWPGIMAGTVLAFARALGEFGATIMFAGNIPQRTQTMSVKIYSAVQSGDRATAFAWAGIIVAISFTSMILMNYWGRLEEKRSGKRSGF